MMKMEDIGLMVLVQHFYKKNPSADGSGKVRDLALAAAQLEKIANIYDNLNLEFF